MSKYDFEIDLSTNSSTGMILSKLRPGSTVLEFGCAAGRMTRYMKEELGCRVYIVEYDSSVFPKAMQYAEDGICDDIQAYRWTQRFAGIAFDAIIFADVLEHLTSPEEVLQKAAAFLKEDGCIYASIPNVTHNDVVLKLWEERFDYTKTGLLDDTHVHFWGLENIRHLGETAGLRVRTIEGTYCAPGDTEQNVQLGQNRLLENILRQRQAGEVYQFVAVLDKQGSGELMCTIGAPTLSSHIYLDTGRDFNAAERFAVTATPTEAGSYRLRYVVENAEKLCRVRLDPIESQGVVCKEVSICQNGEEKPLVAPNAVEFSEGIYIPGDDPMVFAAVDPTGGSVTVTAEFMIPGTDYLAALEEAVREKQQVLETQTRQSREALDGLQEDLRRQRNAAAEEKTALKKELSAQKNLLSQSEEANAKLQTDVCAYILLVNQKEKLAIALEQRVAALEQQVEALEQQKQAMTDQIAERDRAIGYYSNLPVVKLWMFAGRVLRKMKRIAKKLLGRLRR